MKKYAKYVLILVVLAGGALFALSRFQNKSDYTKAKETYEKGIRGDGALFYKSPEYKDTVNKLDSVPSQSPDYAQSEELKKQIADKRREARTENVKRMLEAMKKDPRLSRHTTTTEKPYSEIPSEEPLPFDSGK